MKIIIDADACPRSVLQICLLLGERYDVPVWTVASYRHQIDSENHVTVGGGPQETDIKMMNLSEAGDVAVTQDWGLAAMLLGKQVHCMSPGGREYQSGNIEFMLEEREMKARFRRGGGRTKGPKKRSANDDQRFGQCLDRILQRKTVVDSEEAE
ncbi:DUF188 domain-containing protein [Heliobacterium chlorum]|uniref:UPF0178 protein H1S01_16380 n=1 Tax=Heliobacterium chlorum TaxID=2698 RepID=A0ABR7T5J9_HELCL|nr:DUF188 domain-containing protein [Heliobacterium chlorum]MBC9786048.1 DUF188 domain-containing protein [Heliobacterium chlorum]